jgi:hypothetical protein
MAFTAFKSAQGNGTSKQKTKGGKNYEYAKQYAKLI